MISMQCAQKRATERGVACKILTTGSHVTLLMEVWAEGDEKCIEINSQIMLIKFSKFQQFLFCFCSVVFFSIIWKKTFTSFQYNFSSCLFSWFFLGSDFLFGCFSTGFAALHKQGNQPFSLLKGKTFSWTKFSVWENQKKKKEKLKACWFFSSIFPFTI